MSSFAPLLFIVIILVQRYLIEVLPLCRFLFARYDTRDQTLVLGSHPAQQLSGPNGCRWKKVSNQRMENSVLLQEIQWKQSPDCLNQWCASLGWGRIKRELVIVQIYFIKIEIIILRGGESWKSCYQILPLLEYFSNCNLPVFGEKPKGHQVR